MNYKKKFDDEGFIKCNLSPAWLKKFTEEVTVFSEESDYLSSLSESEFRQTVLVYQDRFNLSGLIRQFFSENKDFIRLLCSDDDFSYSGVGFLRVVRPELLSNSKNEHLGFHREIFYTDGDFVKSQINVHIPIFNYSDITGLKYVPFSHKIPDDDFILEQKTEGDNGIVRGSLEHLNGLMYAPKKIVSGCNLHKAIVFPADVGEAVVFKSDLIHGAGANTSNSIRVSVDFAAINSSAISMEENFQLASKASNGVKYLKF